MRLRWLILIYGIVLLLIAGLREEIMDAVLAFCLGVSSGFLVDWLGIKKLEFWDYPRQPFLGLRYFAITLPDWGVIGMMINLLWNWIEASWLSFIAVTIAIFLTHDLPNLKTKSWNYYAPLWLVVAGWLIFILLSRVLFLALPLINA